MVVLYDVQTPFMIAFSAGPIDDAARTMWCSSRMVVRLVLGLHCRLKGVNRIISGCKSSGLPDLCIHCLAITIVFVVLPASNHSIRFLRMP